MRQSIVVASKAVTRHSRPPQTSTVGGPLPLAKPVPVSVSVVFAPRVVCDTALSVGVALAAYEKEHGRLDAVVDREAGSR